MAKTSRKNKGGFTLIEMTVVITFLVLIAAAIMPNIVSEQKSREARQFFSKARNVVQEARARSMGDRQTRTLRFDESARRLTVETSDPETSETAIDRELELPEGVEGSAFVIEGETSNSSEWSVEFYSDGKSSKGGITFTTNGRPISLSIDDRGTVAQIDGELPSTDDEQWDAGGYEERI